MDSSDGGPWPARIPPAPNEKAGVAAGLASLLRHPVGEAAPHRARARRAGRRPGSALRALAARVRRRPLGLAVTRRLGRAGQLLDRGPRAIGAGGDALQVQLELVRVRAVAER